MKTLPPPAEKSARRTLFLLWGVFAIAQMDRQILSLSLNEISQEFNLNDWQLGLLSGLAFALVFVLVGFPVAALCARANRRNIVAVSVFAWSSFTLLSAAAQNFAQLFLGRMAIGAGEAGAVAPAHSIISDLYPEDRHTSALSTFATGANAGLLLAALIGGVIGQILGWRWAFVISGVPGLIMALLLYRFGQEPARTPVTHPDVDTQNAFSVFRATRRALLADTGIRYALLAFMTMGILTFSMIAWVPTVMIRQYGLNVSQVGQFIALSAGLIGGFGTYFCGRYIDKIATKSPRAPMVAVITAIVIHTIFGMVFLMSTTPVIGLSFSAASAFFGFAFWGATFAYVYRRLDSALRPMATAFFLLSFNMVGMLFGPTTVGLLSNTVFSQMGVMSLGYALMSTKVLGLAAAWFYYKMSLNLTAAT